MRRRRRREGWGLDDLSDLAEPLQRRRLRLYSALFRALEAEGLTIEVAGSPDELCEASDGSGERIAFRIYLRSRQVRRPLTEEERRWSWQANKTETFDLVTAGDLILKIATYTRGAMRDSYTETKRPLEAQLGEIVLASLAGFAELHAWRQERAQEAERRALAQARERQIAQRRALEERVRQKLFAAATAWRQAQDLRGLIAAAERSPFSSDARFSAWREWAMIEADAADPVTAGTLDIAALEPFRPESDPEEGQVDKPPA